MKETFYFSHDYNSRSDEKIKILLRKHGMSGYGCYWAIIEDLYQNANVLRLDYDGIAYDLHIDGKIIESIITDFELFVVNDNTFGSSSVERRLNERKERSRKAQESAFNRWNKPKQNANDKEMNTDALLIECEGNAIKESKGKDRKNIISVFSFDDFWNLYNKKIDTAKCKAKFEKLSERERVRIKETLPTYISGFKDKTYLKYPITYLTGKCWNDDLIIVNNKQNENTNHIVTI